MIDVLLKLSSLQAAKKYKKPRSFRLHEVQTNVFYLERFQLLQHTYTPHTLNIWPFQITAS